MQTFTVKNIEEKQTKDGSKTFFIITDTTGASFSLWQPIGMIKPGCVVEADIQVKGKYANIQEGFKIISQPTGQPAQSVTVPQSRIPFEADPKKQKSIERQVALIQAVLYTTSKGDSEEDIPHLLQVSERFYQWISEGKIPTTVATSTPAKTSQQGVKAEPATDSHAEGQKLPASLKEIGDKLVKLVSDGKWTEARAIQEVEKLGGTGANTFLKIKSLKPDKLQELNKAIEDARNENIPF